MKIESLAQYEMAEEKDRALLWEDVAAHKVAESLRHELLGGWVPGEVDEKAGVVMPKEITCQWFYSDKSCLERKVELNKSIWAKAKRIIKRGE